MKAPFIINIVLVFLPHFIDAKTKAMARVYCPLLRGVSMTISENDILKLNLFGEAEPYSLRRC